MCGLSIGPLDLCAQNATIEEIVIEGHKRTFQNTIRRELPAKIGDTIYTSQQKEFLETQRFMLMNSGLFSDVLCELFPLNKDSSEYRLRVYVEEAWPIYVIPYLELVDRNFNIWAREYDYSLSRINGALKFYYNNMTGHRDYLEASLQFGFHDKVEVEYTYPYCNKKKTWGLSSYFKYLHAVEMPYDTEEKNKQLRWFSDSTLLVKTDFGIRLHIQPGLFTRQKFTAAFVTLNPNEEIAYSLNPEFLNNAPKNMRYLKLAYAIIHDTRNIRPHPTKGFYAEFRIEQQGFSEQRNATTIFGKYRFFYQALPRVTIAETIQSSKTYNHSKVDYYHNRALGLSDDYIRGYEYYLIDGDFYGLSKTSVQYKFHDKQWNLTKLSPIKALAKPSVQMYLTANFDLGYVQSSAQRFKSELNDKMLPGGGIGLEIVAFYDKMIQLEYSINRLGEKDLFLHINFTF